MKIRLGFVSNSSSTSYVIALTRDFKPTPKQLDEFIKNCEDEDIEDNKMDTDQATKAIALIVEKLCSQGKWSWSDSAGIDTGIPNFDPFLEACSDNFKICEVYGEAGGESLANILADDLKDKTFKFTK